MFKKLCFEGKMKSPFKLKMVILNQCCNGVKYRNSQFLAGERGIFVIFMWHLSSRLKIATTRNMLKNKAYYPKEGKWA